MRHIIAFCILVLIPTSTFADCDLRVTIANSSDWSVTVPVDRMRIRARVGAWHRMWPNAGEIEIAAGEEWSRTYSMNACAWNHFHRFEFAIEREPHCVFQGETTTITTTTLGGGGGPLFNRGNRSDPNTGLILQQWPESGFVRNDQLDPDPGRPPYQRDALSVQFNQIEQMCRDARGE